MTFYEMVNSRCFSRGMKSLSATSEAKTWFKEEVNKFLEVLPPEKGTPGPFTADLAQDQRQRIIPRIRP